MFARKCHTSLPRSDLLKSINSDPNPSMYVASLYLLNFVNSKDNVPQTCIIVTSRYRKSMILKNVSETCYIKKGSQINATLCFCCIFCIYRINALRTGKNDALCAYRISYVQQRGCRVLGSLRLSMRHAVQDHKAEALLRCRA